MVKLPTPDMAANLLGGAVNFINRSAFESPRRQITAVAYVSANEKEFDLGKTPGPGREETHKIRPSFRFTYLEPISDKLGVTLSGATQSQYYLQNRAVVGRRYSGSGASVENPQATNVNTTAGGNLQTSNSIAMKVDWKPLEHHVLSFSGEANEFKQMQGSRTLNHSVGNGVHAPR